MDLKPFNRQTDVYDTIKNLTPNTTYYCEFYRTYPKKNAIVVRTKFSFTTPKDETSLFHQRNKNIVTMTGKKSEVFSLKGEKITEITTNLTLSNIKNYLNGIVPKGIYIVISKDGKDRTFGSRTLISIE